MEILNDATSTGKERDWKGKKERSLLMSDNFEQAKLARKAERMNDCGNVLNFKRVEDRLKLVFANFCKIRLCPMCNWRRSMKIAFQNRKIIAAANERKNLKWLFLTLTVRNVEGDQLKETLDNMTKAWNRFVGYAKVKKAVTGFFRALEVTKNRKKNSEWKGTYHPHFHVLIAVTPTYFSKNYISQKEWTSLWKKAMQLDYTPIVHVQRVKPKHDIDVEAIENDVRNAINEQNAILEVSKYPIKDSDILGNSKTVTDESVETVLVLDHALAYKRLIGYGGLLKEIHKELNLDDAEDGNLIHIDSESDEDANGAFEVMAYWHVGIKNYVIAE